MGTNRSDFKLIDYRLTVLFGIILGFVGTMAKLWGMAIFGVILVVIGLVNKRNWGREKKWSELSPSARRVQKLSLIITAVVGLALIVASLAFQG